MTRAPAYFAILVLICAGIGGCASITNMPKGSSYKSVEDKFGSPTIICALPNGGFRAVWSQQPFGQYAWATDVSASGGVGEIVQVLNDDLFRELINDGTWTAKMVECTFGPPAEIQGVGLPSVRKIMWSYRYRQYGVWNMLMNVFFDPATDLVLGHSPSFDPLYEESRWPFFF